MKQIDVLLLALGVLFVMNSTGQTVDYVNYWTDLDMETESPFGPSSLEFTDNSGNTYLLGNFSGVVDFDPRSGNHIDSTLAPGLEGVFLLKLDSAGDFVWSRTIRDSNTSIHVHAGFLGVDGLIHFMTDLVPTTDLDPGSGVVYPDTTHVGSASRSFVTFDLNGNYVDHYTSLYSDFVVDENGNHYHLATYTGAGGELIGYDNGGQPIQVDSSGAYLWKANDQNNIEWIESNDLTMFDYLMELHPNGLIISGVVNTVINPSDVAMGPAVLEVASFDLFFMKYDLNGNYQNAHLVMGGLFTRQGDIEVNTSGEVYVSCEYYGTVQSSDPTVGYNVAPASPADVSYLLMKFDTDLTYEWSQVLYSNVGSSNSFVYHNNIALAPGHYGFGNDSSIHWQVQCNDNLGLSPNFNTNLFSEHNSNSRIAHVALTGDGSLRFALNIGAYMLKPSNVHVTKDGRLIMNGRFYGLVDFDGTEGNYMVNVGQYSKYHLVIDDECALFALPSNIDEVTCNANGAIDLNVYNEEGAIDYYWAHDSLNQSLSTEIQYSGFYDFSIMDSTCAQSYTFYVPGVDSLTALNSDMKLHAVATSRRRVFNANLNLSVQNLGCVLAGDTIRLRASTADSLAPLPVADEVVLDSLLWTTDKMVYGDPIVNIYFGHFIPDIPAMYWWASVNSSALEVTPLDNSMSFSYQTIGSYDPNDIQVSPSGRCPENYVDNDNYLTYHVRFQNTGDAYAHDVVVRDTIDDRLNIQTFRLLDQSHDPLYIELVDDSVLVFKFPNIMLADSTSNEPLSKGYFTFHIQPQSSIDHEVIGNRVGIFFDHNPPIITNTAYSNIVEQIPSCKDFPQPIDISGLQGSQVTADDPLIYPVPVQEVLNIKNSGSFHAYKLSSMQGQVLGQGELRQSNIDLRGMKAGMYILELVGSDERVALKFLKE